MRVWAFTVRVADTDTALEKISSASSDTEAAQVERHVLRRDDYIVLVRQYTKSEGPAVAPRFLDRYREARSVARTHPARESLGLTCLVALPRCSAPLPKSDAGSCRLASSPDFSRLSSVDGSRLHRQPGVHACSYSPADPAIVELTKSGSKPVKKHTAGERRIERALEQVQGPRERIEVHFD
jgi:hypothetical protein